MKKTFVFGKVDGYHNGRRTCATELTVELRDREVSGHLYKTLSICGTIWNNRKTDCIMGGQCLDEMNNFKSLRINPLFAELYSYWKQYHLNDMHAGTREQEQLVKEYFEKNNKRYDYTEACEYLDSIGKKTVKFTGYSTGKQFIDEDYTYGHGWLIEQIPDEILTRIEALLTE